MISSVSVRNNLFKVKNYSTRIRYENCSRLTRRHQNDVNGVTLVLLLSRLYLFNILVNPWELEILP